jgi:hypothetical protein
MEKLELTNLFLQLRRNPLEFPEGDLDQFVENDFVKNHFVKNCFIKNHFVKNHFVENYFVKNLK